jgi:hypothetical protein
MKDGYVKWAESTRPAREGGAEKMPAEKQMPRKGGLGLADLPKVVEDMTQFYNNAKVYAPKVKALLRNKAVQGKIAKGKYAPQMEKIAEYMELVGLGHMCGDADMVQRVGGSKSYKEYCGSAARHMVQGSMLPQREMYMPQREDRGDGEEDIHLGDYDGGRIGMGYMKEITRMAQRHGGADKTLQEKLTEFGLEVYNWLKTNKAVTKAVLESPYLNEKNPLGATGIPKKIKGYMEMVGLGQQEDDFRKQVEASMPKPKKYKMVNKPRKGVFGEELPNYMLEEDTGGAMRQSEASKAAYAKAQARRDEKYATVMRAAESPLGRGKGTRAPSQYAMFVKDFARKHPGPDLMKRAGAAWRSR